MTILIVILLLICLISIYLINKKLNFIIQELNLRDFEDRHVPDYDVIEKE